MSEKDTRFSLGIYPPIVTSKANGNCAMVLNIPTTPLLFGGCLTQHMVKSQISLFATATTLLTILNGHGTLQTTNQTDQKQRTSNTTGYENYGNETSFFLDTDCQDRHPCRCRETCIVAPCLSWKKLGSMKNTEP